MKYQYINACQIYLSIREIYSYLFILIINSTFHNLDAIIFKLHLMGVIAHLIYCLNKLEGHKSKYVSCITSTERHSPGWFSHTGVP